MHTIFLGKLQAISRTANVRPVPPAVQPRGVRLRASGALPRLSSAARPAPVCGPVVHADPQAQDVPMSEGVLRRLREAGL
jgi:hypothetical protein